MSAEYREKLASIGFAHRHRGKTNTTVVDSDERLGPAGVQTEHWDGRVDAIAVNPTITVNPALEARRVPQEDP